MGQRPAVLLNWARTPGLLAQQNLLTSAAVSAGAVEHSTDGVQAAQAMDGADENDASTYLHSLIQITRPPSAASDDGTS